MANELDGKWLASEYMDNGHWGVLTHDNTIVLGISLKLTRDECERIAAYHNERIGAVWVPNA